MVQSRHLVPISRTTVGDEIVRRLISFIMEQNLKPGDKLPSERELMALLSVGRSSLREAIRTLSAVGVVRVTVRQGMFVGSGESSIMVFSKPLAWALLLHERSTREVIEARRAVEVELAGLAAQRATGKAVVTIERQFTAMSAAVDDGNAYTQCDLAFHAAVASAADSHVLYHVFETLLNIIQAWIEKAIQGNQGRPQSLDEHVPILEAIRMHDVSAAREAMAAHLDAAASRLVNLVSSAESGSNGDENSAVEVAQRSNPVNQG